MAGKRKSKGYLLWERNVAEIYERAKRGEIPDDSVAVMNEFQSALEKALPYMSKREVKLFLVKALSVHAAGAKILDDAGQPYPGNDPKLPN